jgi:hypothetical protein
MLGMHLVTNPNPGARFVAFSMPSVQRVANPAPGF